MSTRPELVRSWVTDAGAIGDPDFEWHDFAKIWQTPGEGEDFFAQQLATPVEESAVIFESLRGTRRPGPGCWSDGPTRRWPPASSRSTGRRWTWARSGVPTSTTSAVPGLALLPSEDPFLSADGARASARRAGVDVVELDGLGHWWMLQDPARGAAVLTDFWASLS